MREISRLFFHRIARFFPAFEAAVQVNDARETQFLKLFQGIPTASAGCAVHNISGAAIEFGNLVREIVGVEINILGSGDVTLAEFIRGADVENDDGVVIGKQFGRLPQLRRV